MTVNVPILCYHSQIITSNDYVGNGHIALRSDLESIASSGFRVVPLQWLIDAYSGYRDWSTLERCVSITFDDGSCADFTSIDYPGFGLQPGFLPIMQQAKEQYSDTLKDLHATSFVIADPTIREQMDTESLFGLDWMNDDWWALANITDLLTIECHGWDHFHNVMNTRGKTRMIDIVDQATADDTACDWQVLQACEHIAKKSHLWPSLFAYPFGIVSQFLSTDYFPNHQSKHRLKAAFSTAGEYATPTSNIWSIPRFVHGHHWKTSNGFSQLLDQSTTQ